MNEIWKIAAIGATLLAGQYAARANHRTRQLKTAAAVLNASTRMNMYLADILDKNEVPLSAFDKIAINELTNIQ